MVGEERSTALRSAAVAVKKEKVADLTSPGRGEVRGSWTSP
jgi:hypothetical protein